MLPARDVLVGPLSRALSARMLGALRLQSQKLVASTLAAPVDAVRALLAMQGQDYAGAKWAVGLRVPGSTDASVEAQIAAGTIVRSWPLRGTLHLVAAEDLPWLLSLSGPRMMVTFKRRHIELGLDARTLERAREVALARLSGGKCLTREELLRAFEDAGISTAGQRGYHTLGYLAHTGTLCFGPMQGKEQAFVLLGEWVKRPRSLDREEALKELALRYFTSHGPASLKDFSAWTKLLAGDIKAALALAAPELVEVRVDGVSHWMSPKVLDAASSTTPALLLPGFDEFVLGYLDRSAVLPDQYKSRICPGGNGVFANSMIYDGHIVGTWRRPLKSAQVAVDLQPFVKLPRAVTDAFATAAEGYGRFLARSVAVL